MSFTNLVEHLKCLLDLLLGIGILHLACHHRQELWEIDRSVTISIDFIDHILRTEAKIERKDSQHHIERRVVVAAACLLVTHLQLSLSRVLAERANNRPYRKAC